MCPPGSSVARVRAPKLSSCTAALKVRNRSLLRPISLLIDVNTVIIGMAARRAIGSAMYSDSMVDVAIEACNLEHQTTEHSIISMM